MAAESLAAPGAPWSPAHQEEVTELPSLLLRGQKCVEIVLVSLAPLASRPGQVDVSVEPEIHADQ